MTGETCYHLLGKKNSHGPFLRARGGRAPSAATRHFVTFAPIKDFCSRSTHLMLIQVSQADIPQVQVSPVSPVNSREFFEQTFTGHRPGIKKMADSEIKDVGPGNRQDNLKKNGGK